MSANSLDVLRRTEKVSSSSTMLSSRMETVEHWTVLASSRVRDVVGRDVKSMLAVETIKESSKLNSV